jgi:hypothetical protein
MIFTLFFDNNASGQIDISTTASHTQTFNTLATSGTSNAWTNNSTIANWYSQRTGSGTTYAADAGTGTGGNLYSYGTGTNTERALGTIGSSNAAAGNFAHGVLLRNTSGSTVTDIKVSYTLEQWRSAGAVTANTVTFWYRTSSSPISALNPNSNGTWTQVTGLSLSSPINSGSAGALDGNASANRVSAASVSIPSLSLANNDFIMLKWEDPDHTGTDHGLAIDDVTIAWTAIFLPTVTTTTPATSISTTTADAAGNITATGGANATIRGVEYSTTNGFANGTGTQVTESGTFSTGTFTRSLSGLNAGTTYYFKAFATNSVGTSYGAQASFITLPDAPATPSASGVGPTGFTVNWGAVTGAASYRLDVATDAAFTSLVSGYNDLSVAGTSQPVSGLIPTTTYYARVRAINATGSGANSGTLTQATDAATSPTISVTGTPSARTTTVGTPSASTSVAVSGTNLTANITATAPSTNFEVSSDDTVWGPTATFTQTSGSASGTLYIRLSAAAPASSPAGNVVLSSTDATDQNVAVTGTVFKAEPTNHATGFAAGTITTTNIPAAWTAASPEPDGYLLKVSSGSVTDPVDGSDPTNDTSVSDGSAQVKVTPGSAISYSGFTGFAAGSTYTFALFPYNNSGTNINFKVASAPTFSAVLLPVAPATPTFASVTATGFTVNWDAVTGATDYRLDVATDSGFTSFVSGYSDLTVASNSQAVTGLTPNTAYHARVRAVNATGTSANSTTASQTTAQLPAPVAIAADPIGAVGFTANWNAVSGATGYELEWRGLVATSDDFSDSNFTANPAWSGNTSNFAVSTAATLPSGTAATDGFFLASNASVGNATLTTPSTETSEWRFSLGSPTFNGSSANFFGVILMSSAAVTGDPTAVAANWNGYYLKVGVDNATDPIELWRRSGTTSTKVGDFPSSPNFAIGALAAGINVRVTRSVAGVFELFTDTGFTYSSAPTTSRGTLTDTTHSSSSNFGVFTRFANPDATRRVYLDNIVLPNSPVSVPLATYTVGNVTSYAITGAATSTAYTYVVRATSASSTSANSNVINVTTTAGDTAPTLTAAAGATVDAAFDVTFTDDATWRSAITGVTVDVDGIPTPLTAGYSVAAGTITFTPSASIPAGLLQTAGTKAIVVTATGYTNTTVSQAIGAGAATQLAVTTQPTAPAANGSALAVQPVVAIRDQFGNLCSSTATVTAAVGSGTWTLGGTTGVDAVAGTVTFADLTATSPATVNGATISFTSGSLTGATSAPFTVPGLLFVTFTGTALTENFDSMGTGNATPNGWSHFGALGGNNGTWTSSIPVSGAQSAASAGTVNNNLIVNSNAAAASFTSNTQAYNYALSDSTSDRALGTSPGSGAGNILQYRVVNGSGAPVTSVDVSYDIRRFTTVTTDNELPGYQLFYSLDNGSTWTNVTGLNPALTGATVNVPNTVGVTTVPETTITLGAPLAEGAEIRFRWIDDNADQTSPDQIIGLDNVVVGFSSDPTIASVGSVAAFTTTFGTVSAEQTFAISGVNLGADITATAPTGFEVSSDGTTYGTTATFIQASGAASGSLRIRLAATAPVLGSYDSQNIVLSSAPAPSVNITTLAAGNVVSKATPTITTVPTASDITSGQTLADSVLTGGVASVPGTFAFTTPSTVPAEGTASQGVTFTPTDSANYNNATTTASVTVNPSSDPLFTDPTQNAVLSEPTPGVSRLSFTGIPGRVYGIQRSATLSGWTQIDTVTAPGNGVVTFDDPSPLPGKGFYRIIFPAE